MSLDQRHLQLRQQLDALGFNHPLPIGALGLVSALLDDLIQTTESLKDAKDEINSLLEAKNAWDLGVEPYKCDNTRLLAEVNDLHLEMLKQRDTFEIEASALRIKVRNLEYDNHELEERCAEQLAKIRELELKFCDSEKTRKNGVNYNRRPFCSAVKANYYVPPSLQFKGGHPMGGSGAGNKCKCNSNIRHNDVLAEIEKLQVEVKNQNELVETMKKQISVRDHEISRLHALLNTNGRPDAALAKDCCYRNVVKLSEDVEYLQAQKIELHSKLSGKAVHESDAVRKMIRMSEMNKKLEQDLKDLEKVALALETKANETVLEKEKEILALKNSIKDLQEKVHNLERGVYKYESSEFYNIKKTLHDMTEEKRSLTKKLNELKMSERLKKEEIHKLHAKIEKLKSRLLHESHDDEEIEHLRDEKEHYFKEYTKLLETSRNAIEHAEKHHTVELAEKNLEIASLKSQINEMKRISTSLSSHHREMHEKASGDAGGGGGGIHCHSTHPSIHRLERERDVAVALKEQAIMERERMLDKLNATMDAHAKDQQHHRMVVDELNQQIRKLESDIRCLTASQRPNSAKIDSLQTETCHLKEQIEKLENDNSHLRTSNSQLKLLLEQTERSMTEQKEKLSHSEHHLSHSEHILQKLEKEHSTQNCELSSLRSEITILKSTKQAFEKEKDRLIDELDKKTERIYQLESDLDVLRSTKRSLQDTISRLQIQMNALNSENVQRQLMTKSSTDEVEVLKKQIAALKKTSDTALNENCRLSNELADTVAELRKERQNTKKAIDDKEQLKNEIQQYVLEVDRVNALLTNKEAELFGMANSYQTATEDAESLTRMKTQLANETQEIRGELQKAQEEIEELRKESKVKSDIVSSYERQISNLSSKLTTLEEENEQLKYELKKSEETLNELRREKDKLSQEIIQLQSKVQTTSTSSVLHESPNNSLQDLLTQKSNECEKIRTSATQMSQEVVRLKCRIDELQAKFDDEHAAALKSEALAKEYKVQVQELRRLLTDDRFTQLRSLEQPNPYPTL